MAHRKVLMSENVRISLGNPVLIFVYSLAILLLGCAIGMHWYQSRASAIWIAVAAAALMVVHDMLTGLLFASLTFRRFQKEQRAGRNPPSLKA
jgi:membrane protein YdbS with pleckstrin-like domain